MTEGRKYISKVFYNVYARSKTHALSLFSSHFPHCWSAFYRSAGCDVIAVIGGMTTITWFYVLTNQRHSAFRNSAFYPLPLTSQLLFSPKKTLHLVILKCNRYKNALPACTLLRINTFVISVISIPIMQQLYQTNPQNFFLQKT